MDWIYIVYREILGLLEQGGLVLWCILLVGTWLYTILVSTWCELPPIEEAIRMGSKHVEEVCSEEQLHREYHIFKLDRLAWVDRRMPVIGVMVGICTLGGLLGTVSGMLVTFTRMSSGTFVDPMEKIAEGISEAMITTQVGLLFALPAAFAYAILVVRVRKVHALAEQQLSLDLVQYHKEGGGNA